MQPTNRFKPRSHALWAAVAISMLTALPSISFAGRGIPAPLLFQLEEGYGVVAAEVTGAESLPSEYGRLYRVQCRVVEVVARHSGDFPLAAGDTFETLLGVGYGAAIEDIGGELADADPRRPDGPVADGDKLYLTVRNVNGAWEQAYGAGAVRHVKAFDADAIRLYGTLSNVARTPMPERVTRALSLLSAGDSLEAERSEVLHWLPLRFQRFEPAVRSQVQSHLMDRLRSADKLSHSEFNNLDYTLRDCVGRPYTESTERAEALVKRWLTPFPPNPADIEAELRARDRGSSYIPRTLLEQWPDRYADVIREMNDSRWPLLYRWRMATAMQAVYQRSETEYPAWRDALHQWYPAAIGAADAWETRLVISWLAHDTFDSHLDKRRFEATPEILAALERALVRITKPDEKHPQASNAATEIREALRAATQPAEPIPEQRP